MFHVALICNTAFNLGIEYVRLRDDRACGTLHDLNYPCPVLLQQLDREGLDPQKVRSSLKRIQFTRADATTYPQFDFSHIYCYDYVFGPETHQALLPIIEASPFKVFVCYSSPAKLKRFGVSQFRLLEKIQVYTTGKQRFTVYFYAKP